jgi:hypothetical protein
MDDDGTHRRQHRIKHAAVRCRCGPRSGIVWSALSGRIEGDGVMMAFADIDGDEYID